MALRIAVALGVGLALTAIAVAAVLARSPLRVAGTNSVPPSQYAELRNTGRLSNCQPSGTIPKGTSAIGVGVEGLFFSPAVSVEVLAGSRVLSEGHQIAGGVSGPTVTVPVETFTHTVTGALVCTAIGPAKEIARYYGVPRHTTAPATNELQELTLHMKYLRPGPKSWWSLASSIFRHMGIGRSPGGTWVAYLVIVLMLAIVVAVSRITLKELR
jgi:hypothetical protein